MHTFSHIQTISHFKQVEIEGLTGDIRFNEDGRRINYTLSVVEMSSNSDMVKVAEWSDQFKFRPIANRPDRIAPRNDFERNRTYIVTTIIEEPYIMLKKSKFDSNQAIEEKDKYIGYCKDLADILAKRLGIKCKFIYFYFFFFSSSKNKCYSRSSHHWNRLDHSAFHSISNADKLKDHKLLVVQSLKPDKKSG